MVTYYTHYATWDYHNHDLLFLPLSLFRRPNWHPLKLHYRLHRIHHLFIKQPKTKSTITPPSTSKLSPTSHYHVSGSPFHYPYIPHNHSHLSWTSHIHTLPSSLADTGFLPLLTRTIDTIDPLCLWFHDTNSWAGLGSFLFYNKKFPPPNLTLGCLFYDFNLGIPKFEHFLIDDILFRILMLVLLLVISVVRCKMAATAESNFDLANCCFWTLQGNFFMVYSTPKCSLISKTQNKQNQLWSMKPRKRSVSLACKSKDGP